MLFFVILDKEEFFLSSAELSNRIIDFARIESNNMQINFLLTTFLLICTKTSRIESKLQTS
jgi:hypothetical protein